jgi:hypothetical protein
VAAKGQVKKIKGAKKLRRIGRRAAGLKVDNYGRYYRERRVERHKVARMAQSNGPECGEAARKYFLRFGYLACFEMPRTRGECPEWQMRANARVKAARARFVAINRARREAELDPIG